MDYRTFHLRSVQGSSDWLQLYPEPGFAERWQRGMQHRVTLGGHLHTFQPAGEALAFDVPLGFVNSSQRDSMTTWWREGHELAFTMNLSDDDRISVRVQMVNPEEPLGGRHPGNAGLFGGLLYLREIDPQGKVPGGPFILDDPVWGKLDQTYNRLI